MLNETDLARADLNLLTLFAVVAEVRHVGKAAERLNLSPSAVSHGLGRLRRLLNDPLFLRTPKGVVPTARALELAAPIADVLSRARAVIASADPFDPATSRRRFVIAAPDGVSAVLLPKLLAVLKQRAPGIDIGVRQLLPTSPAIERAWDGVSAELDARTIDIAISPLPHPPARFASRLVYEEEFVVAAHPGHAFAKSPTMARFCEARHLVVSQIADPHGLLDATLAKTGQSRRVVLTVPDFMMALAMVAEGDLLAAMPSRFAALHGKRFGVVSRKVPFAVASSAINAMAPRAAMLDAGLAWLFDLIAAPKAKR